MFPVVALFKYKQEIWNQQQIHPGNNVLSNMICDNLKYCSFIAILQYSYSSVMIFGYKSRNLPVSLELDTLSIQKFLCRGGIRTTEIDTFLGLLSLHVLPDRFVAYFEIVTSRFLHILKWYKPFFMSIDSHRPIWKPHKNRHLSP